MINTLVKVHDKFTVEFKIGFVVSEEQNVNEFKINTWMFLPNGLDINKNTYKKEQFYTDIKSNVRLITPVFPLSEILKAEEGPFFRLQNAYDILLNVPDENTEESFFYQSKMFLCITKSALREAMVEILAEKEAEKRLEKIEQYIHHISKIAFSYRQLRDELLNNACVTEKQCEYFLFGDEFLTYTIEQTTFEMLRLLRENNADSGVQSLLMPLIHQEVSNKKLMGYSIPEEGNEEKNSMILTERSLLKKFVESDLYLQRVKKKDGVFVREFYYSLAAALAMIFATIVSFFATQKYGNFTSTLFFVLVISYIFKDRIKEFARIYFASKLDRKYFDHKWKVSIRNQPIGWIKEAFDFISEGNMPTNIMRLRNKTPLVKAENEVYDEKIILFRKRVQLSKNDLEKYKEYRLSGINDIIRLNLTSFIKKMDNPSTYIYLPDEENGYKSIRAKRVYSLFFIIQCESGEDVYFKKYRLLLNRDGISDVNEIE